MNLRFALRRWLFAALFALVLANPGVAALAAENFAGDAAVDQFIAEMVARHAFDQGELAGYFSGLAPNPAVLRAIAPAAVPEQQRSWERYRARFLSPRQIAAGERFWQQNAASLARARALFGVPEEIVVAIIGIETAYGANTGRFGVMEALATLAFRYPPRAAFFRQELEEFLLVARANALHPPAVKGSYAGAIGIPQFMPSSLRRHAVDFDGDGRIDLLASRADAIGSAASFLAAHGWQADGPIAVRARVATDPAPWLALGIAPATSVEQFAASSISAISTISAPAAVAPTENAALIELMSPGQRSEYWLGFNNFYVITRYNRSSFYAMAVYQLASAIARSRAANGGS